MSDDLIARLEQACRYLDDLGADADDAWDAVSEAAVEIERLRSALELIADGLPTMDGRPNIDSKRFAAGVLERGE